MARIKQNEKKGILAQAEIDKTARRVAKGFKKRLEDIFMEMEKANLKIATLPDHCCGFTLKKIDWNK
jgi:hypothetical protein